MTVDSMSFSIGAWTRFAACRDADPGIFFPDDEHDAGAAKRICASCMVSADCQLYARTTREPAGIWGGQTTGERQRAATGPHQLLCRECNSVFEAPDRRARLCSDTCRQAARRRTVAAANRRRRETAA